MEKLYFEEPHWDLFIEETSHFPYLAQCKDKTIMYIVKYETPYLGELKYSEITEKDFDLKDRSYLMNCNGYIEYVKRQSENGKSNKLTLVKYNIIEKVFDSNNNLIIIAYANQYELGNEMPQFLIDIINKQNESPLGGQYVIYQDGNYSEVEVGNIYDPNDKQIYKNGKLIKNTSPQKSHIKQKVDSKKNGKS